MILKTDFIEVERIIEESEVFLEWENGWSGPESLKPDVDLISRAWGLLREVAEKINFDFDSFKVCVSADSAVTISFSNREKESRKEIKTLMIMFEPDTRICRYSHNEHEIEKTKTMRGWKSLDLEDVSNFILRHYSVAN